MKLFLLLSLFCASAAAEQNLRAGTETDTKAWFTRSCLAANGRECWSSTGLTFMYVQEWKEGVHLGVLEGLEGRHVGLVSRVPEW